MLSHDMICLSVSLQYSCKERNMADSKENDSDSFGEMVYLLLQLKNSSPEEKEKLEKEESLVGMEDEEVVVVESPPITQELNMLLSAVEKPQATLLSYCKRQNRVIRRLTKCNMELDVDCLRHIFLYGEPGIIAPWNVGDSIAAQRMLTDLRMRTVLDRVATAIEMDKSRALRRLHNRAGRLNGISNACELKTGRRGSDECPIAHVWVVCKVMKQLDKFVSIDIGDGMKHYLVTCISCYISRRKQRQSKISTAKDTCTV